MSKLKYYDGTDWKVVNGQVTGDTLPIGAIVPFGGWDAPTGWLICDGTLLNKTTYPELFNAIGYSFGGEEGGSTFGLPDLRGRVPLGLKETDTDFNGMGLTGGSKDAVVVSHTHSNTNNALSWVGGSGLGNTNWLAADGKQVTYSTIANPNGGVKAGWMGNANAVINSAGESGVGKNLQPYQTVNYIIKAKQSAGLVANVSNIQSESTTDTYSCDYINGDVLYTGTTGGSITLNETAANYSAIEIFYKSSDSVYLNTGKIYSPNGKNVGLYAPYSIGTTCYSKQAQVSISGTALTISNEIETQLWASNEKVKINQPASGSHYFTIEKVIGYK